MTRKDIDKAAGDYSGSILGCKGSSVTVKRQSFIDGAKWRINSIWHDVEESPKQGSLIAVFDGKDMHLWRAEDIVNMINGIRVVSITVKECFVRQHIIKWAYVEDLLPIKDE